MSESVRTAYGWTARTNQTGQRQPKIPASKQLPGISEEGGSPQLREKMESMFSPKK